METLIVICSVMSIIISLPAICIALFVLVEIKAFQRSTHKIEYMPVPMPKELSDADNKEFMEGFMKDEGKDFLI